MSRLNPQSITHGELTRFHKAGLERFFRLIQAILQVTIYYEAPLNLLVGAIGLLQGPHVSPAVSSVGVTAVLRVLRSRFAIGRRFFRLFRFAESFYAANRLWGSLSSTSTSRVETYLGVLDRTFNGMYLLLETAHFPDALGVEGLSVWGEHAPAIAIEAQRFWFLSLICGALVGMLRLLQLWAYAAVPETGSDYGVGGDGKEQMDSSDGREKDAATDVNAEGRVADTLSLRQPSANENRKTQRLVQQRERAARLQKISRRLVADVLDLAIPGSVVGYVNLDDGPVGLAMLITTILTGLEVWERCGREVDAASK